MIQIKRVLPVVLALAPLAIGCGGSKAENPCAGVSGTCVAFKSGTDEKTMQTAFVEAKPGTTFAFGTGAFTFKTVITILAEGITLKGQGMDKTLLDFKGQAAGGEGISVTGNHFLAQDFAIRDTADDGIKVEGSTGVTFRRVKVSWTNANPTDDGGYGIYPVQCHQVLIENCFTSGASDTGIYVGQSEDIIVRNNEATGNVAGIEIENSHRADVYGNDSHDNCGGILVFSLPGLQQKDGWQVRVHDNKIRDNNLKNFAPAGNIVGQVPRGTGVIVMAAHDVEIFGNTISNHKTSSLSIVSFLLLQVSYSDPAYYPFPASIHVHDNTFVGGGDAPDQTNALGQLLDAARPGWGGKVPDMGYDGILDPAVAGTRPGNSMDVCIGATPSGTWVNFHGDTIGVGGFPKASTDPAPYQCSLPALPAVSF